MSDPLKSIIEKCEQYWNEPNLGDAEIHAALECIHRWARVAAQHLKREQEPAPRDSCQCRLNDAWRCAVERNLKAIACPCACHKRVAAQPPQELVSLDHKELASFFWRHAPVLWKDRWTCRCGKWALSRELNSVEQADESRSQHVAEAFLEWRAALTRGAVGNG